MKENEKKFKRTHERQTCLSVWIDNNISLTSHRVYNLLLDAVYVRRLQRSLSVARDDDDDDDGGGGGGDGGGDAEGAEDCDSENITVPSYSRAALRQVSHTEWHVDS